VGFVAVPLYKRGAATVLAPMRRAEPVQGLADNAFNFHRWGACGLRLLAAVVAAGDCYRLRVGALDEACDVIAAVTSSWQC
jgi:hypothetical protein